MDTTESKNGMLPYIIGVGVILVVALIVAASVWMMDKDENMNADEGVMVGGAMMVPEKNIVENAMNADNVTTLVSAVTAADLAETLTNGEFTVFAPTDDAFDKLPEGTVATLVKPENKDKLVSILTYHVVPGRYKMSDLEDGQKLTTVNGQMIEIEIDGSSFMVNGAKVETKDVISSNGVTHVIDTVLMPQEGVMVGGALMVPSLDIVDNALNADNVTTVVDAVVAAGLVDTLKSEGPFTVFAPNNSAFNKLPDGTVATLLMAENKDQLVKILTYHVVAGRYKISDLTDGQVLTTVQGQTLTVKKMGNTVMINDATIETKDVISSNGVTHVIDSVLMPQ